MRRLLFLVLVLPAIAPVPAAAFPAPNRPVAGIVSPVWSDEATRDSAGEAATVIARLGLKPGQNIADIGAGTGYYTLKLAPLVAPGTIYAQDVSWRYLERLKARVAGTRLRNIRFVLGRGADARLPPASVDVALMVHMYHEIEQPFGLLHRLRVSLKPGGRVAIVDLDRPTTRHGTPRALLVCELKAVGYDLLSISNLADGYLAVFRPGAAVDPARIKPCAG